MKKVYGAGIALFIALCVALALLATGASAHSVHAGKTAQSITIHTQVARPFGGRAFSARRFGVVGVRARRFGVAGIRARRFGVVGVRARRFGVVGIRARRFGVVGIRARRFGVVGIRARRFGVARFARVGRVGFARVNRFRSFRRFAGVSVRSSSFAGFGGRSWNGCCNSCCFGGCGFGW